MSIAVVLGTRPEIIKKDTNNQGVLAAGIGLLHAQTW